MKNKILFLITSVYLSSNLSSQTYNNLWIPDTLSGVNFSLTIKDTIKQLRPGNQTITGSVNNNFGDLHCF